MNNDFKWTDDLVKEFGATVYKSLSSIDGIVTIEQFKESKKPKPNQPVFTANGADYFYNDPYFRVFNDDFSYSAHVALEAPDKDYLAICKFFKTREQVLDYIFLNKPKLVSIKEVHDAVSLGEGLLIEKLSTLFKSKTM